MENTEDKKIKTSDEMDSAKIRSRFLNFFGKRGHKILPSTSLVSDNPSESLKTLFTTAGMQQFKPYYTASENAIRDFGTKDVATIQKCVRTGDIDEVGDDTHLTFFEMLGNFSFGGYGKEKAIEYAYEFITKELKLTIDYVSVFEGDNEISADDESKEAWKKIAPDVTIKNHNREDNFWGPTGEEGPCGPTTEIYIDGVEIWNIVFNEYYKTREGKYEPLAVKGVDTGMGLERLAMVLQKKNNVFETDLFTPVMWEITKQYDEFSDERAKRIIADHIRTAVFVIADGVTPSNTERGYVLRRLIRKITHTDKSKSSIAEVVIENYKKQYPELLHQKETILGEIQKEEERFRKTLFIGLKQFEKGEDPFTLFTTYGFPIEYTRELARKKGIIIDEEDFQKKFKKHQELSRTSSAGMFKGGLASHNEKTVKLHTAHDLLLATLQEVLGKNVKQRGSNITEERLRIDFSFGRKMTDEEKKQVEDVVNNHISQNLSVTRCEMSREEAEKIGAEMEFGAKYPDTVSVYFIENKEGNAISKEFCGGPHVERTGILGKFKIKKEEAVSAGARRIKAILE